MNVYDFDKTIFYVDCTADFYKWEIKRNPSLLRYAPKQLVGFGLFYVLHVIDKTKMKDFFYSYLKGVKDIHSEVEQYWDSHMNYVNDFYKQRHKEDDVVISASAEFMIEPICRRLHIKNFIASQVDPIEGKTTGINNLGERKIVNFTNAGYKLEDIDEFYSDSMHDLPLAKVAKKAYRVKNGKLSDWEIN